jgi:hypothetical protein
MYPFLFWWRGHFGRVACCAGILPAPPGFSHLKFAISGPLAIGPLWFLLDGLRSTLVRRAPTIKPDKPGLQGIVVPISRTSGMLKHAGVSCASFIFALYSPFEKRRLLSCAPARPFSPGTVARKNSWLNMGTASSASATDPMSSGGNASRP